MSTEHDTDYEHDEAMDQQAWINAALIVAGILVLAMWAGVIA